uniref:Protein kinase, AMP-activated, beta 1 non-catalytic subunit, a n=1 Tax=Oryzias sinensis TaxID=183150 RepID=A0A8C7V304_9TELE
MSRKEISRLFRSFHKVTFFLSVFYLLRMSKRGGFVLPGSPVLSFSMKLTRLQQELSSTVDGGQAPSEKDEFLAWQQDLEAEDKDPNLDRPTVFRWTGDGKEVFVSGSFNNWANKIPLIRSQNTFVAIVDLPEGEHQYKFYVDGQWTHDPTEPVITSQLGTVNNIIQVKKTDFEVFDALMVDSQKSSDMSDLSSSPPGPYHQDPYVPKQEEKFKSPPILPPHLLQVILNKDTGISCDPALLPEPNHVMLNHLYALSIKDGVMVLSATHRYKKKYVTTLLYKPI